MVAMKHQDIRADIKYVGLTDPEYTVTIGKRDPSYHQRFIRIFFQSFCVLFLTSSFAL